MHSILEFNYVPKMACSQHNILISLYCYRPCILKLSICEIYIVKYCLSAARNKSKEFLVFVAASAVGLSSLQL